MINVEKYNAPYFLYSDWKNLHVRKKYTPFQSYEYNRILFECHYLRRKNWKYHILFLRFNDETRCAIWALKVNKKERIIYNISHNSPMDYYDILSNSDDISFHKGCLLKLRQIFRGFSIVFENVVQGSILNDVFESYTNEQEPCVHIKLDDYLTHEEYLQSLSKHQRQNIRTAYNKVNKVGMNIVLREYTVKHNRLPFSHWMQCLIMYVDRTILKICRCGGSVSALARINRIKNMMFSVSSLSHWIMKDSKVYVLYLSCQQNRCEKEDIAAFMFTYHDADVVFVGTLSSSLDYKQYDAGIILVNEVVKKLIISKIKVLDLTRGDEPYKYAMGGVSHDNVTYRCD